MACNMFALMLGLIQP